MMSGSSKSLFGINPSRLTEHLLGFDEHQFRQLDDARQCTCCWTKSLMNENLGVLFGRCRYHSRLMAAAANGVKFYMRTWKMECFHRFAHAHTHTRA